MKRKEEAVVLSQREISSGIYDMWIETKLAEQAKAGQFIVLYPKDRSLLMPRPISICEIDGYKRSIRIVYRVAGDGTREFATYQEGDVINIMGVLGNGYNLKAAKGKKVLLIGGGIGIPPLVELAREMALMSSKLMIGNTIEIVSALGYRDSDTFLRSDLEAYSRVYVATEDGSTGARGTVMDAIEDFDIKADMIFACGPLPMLRSVKQLALEWDVPAYLSLEEHMACGIGACLGCVVKTTQPDAHSHVNNARICTEGPVFEAREVEI
jgi:dihydroorotate dehydrogenase electron transfer subunit